MAAPGHDLHLFLHVVLMHYSFSRNPIITLLLILLPLFLYQSALAANINLAWDPNTEPDLAGYRVYYGTASGTYGAPIDVKKVTTYTLTGLTLGQTYFLAVTAYDTSGNESDYSNEVSGTAKESEAVSTPSVLSGPTTGTTGTSYTYSTGGSSSNLGHSVQYEFDWKGNASDLSPWGSASQSKTWVNAGTYNVRSRARCTTHTSIVSKWSSSLSVAVSAGPQSYTVTTNPSGLQITIDDVNYTAPRTFSWTPGTSHKLSVSSPQNGTSGTRYLYSSWSDSGAQTHTITVPSSGRTYTANFTTQYSLTTSASPLVGGSVSPSGTNWYNSSQSVSVSSTANNGYSFLNWSGDLTGSTKPKSLSMNGPKNVVANFTQIQYSLTVNINPSGSGSVSKNPNKSTYVYGDQVTLTATANSGYTFNNWSGNVTGATNPITLTINGNKTATANFSAPETISTPTAPSGSTTGIINTSYTCSTGGSLSNYGHSLEYRFDWGNGSYSNWSSLAKASKKWTSAGIYMVRAQARCTQHTSFSFWSGTLGVNIRENILPSPSPITWISVPYPNGSKSISMVATTATDSTSPISYYFDFVDSPTGGLGGKDSGWQAETSYTNSNLQANNRYGYRVKAKDGVNNQQTAYSTTQYAYTAIQVPTGITFETITSTTIQARSTNSPTGLSWGKSGLLIQNTTNATSSGWKRGNTFWTSKSLTPNTSYSFRATSRNGDGIETGYGPSASKYTRANLPGKASFSNVTRTSIRANWTVNGNPSGTQYLCQNVTTGASSGWITGTSWNSDNLGCGISYSFRVKAKNQEGVETGWASLGSEPTPKCVMLLAPNGGDMIASGSNYYIRWDPTPEAVSFDLFYSLDRGVTWISIAKDLRNTIHRWTVPKASGNKKACFVRVIGYNAARTEKIGSDTSDKPFAIEVVRLTSPNGGPPSLRQNETVNITWTAYETTQPITKVQLSYTKDGGATYNSIITLSGAYPPGTYSQSWTVPSAGTAPKTNCKVKVVLLDTKGVIRGSDVNDNFFTIEP